MGFLSLYRKYRPHNFEDLVGQRHIVKTLKNAIAGQRIAHAYLFAGPRGTGKTSTAKIFAQALNCKEGPTPKPCGECQNCIKIQSGQSIDVIEIDAASNRGIDEIRDLREKVKFYPGEGLYKVYIIDEVHMLTTGAFNALLKTLEEPPENVIFILATTEPYKVIDTIMSRCQRFDFSLLSTGDISGRLKIICEEEGVEFEEEALLTIARAANGGLRDAIAMLDQAISFTDFSLTADSIQEMLGRVDKSVLDEFYVNLAQNRVSENLELLNELVNSGYGISIFVNDIIEYIRLVLLAGECGVDSRIFDYSPERIEEIKDKIKMTGKSKLLNYLQVLTEVERKLNYTEQPRLILEMGIIEMSSKKNNNIIEKGSENNSAVHSKKKKAEAIAEPIKEETVIDNKKDKANVKSKNRQSDDADFGINEVKESWSKLLKEVKKENIRIQAFLVEGRPLEIDDNMLYIEFPQDKNFHKKGAEKEAALVQRVINKTFNSKWKLKFLLEGEKKNIKKAESKSFTQIKPSRNTADKESVLDVKQEKQEKLENKVMNEIIKAFDGEIVKVNHDILNDSLNNQG